MDIKDFITELVAVPGVSGYEERIARIISKAFNPYCQEVKTDAFFNVYGRKTDGQGENIPKVMLAAHMDEIGLMVTDIDESGFIRFTNIGGVDPRILPGQEVEIHGKEKLFGVIGAKPPHLQGMEDAKKAIKMQDMAIDVGLSAERARELIKIGDIITFVSPLVELKGSMVSGKSLDDRAGVATLLATMKELDKLRFCADVYFVATVQEEVGVRGAVISAYRLNPDIGIAIDVTHGDMPDAPRDETFAMNKGPVIAVGPNMHPRLTQKLMDTAKEYGIDYMVEVEPGPTGTDARAIQISRYGVPTVLIGIPLRYMHTTVETLNLDNIKQAARLLARFIASLKEDWNEWLNY
ncbi:MAG: M42 family metallopeptidase [Clostridiales bacterium]|jgi:endoglucanase|nr:M42 family metallopeptidase [Clostridiales bacterium]